MPYILNKTNGTVVATVNDASLDLTTNLTFLGRNYAGYGEVQNENFLKLLENFSNSTAPTRPIEGQLWYNATDKQLNVYDNIYWKPIANLEVNSETNIPSDTKNPVKGDLWYNTNKDQLNVYNGSDFIVVGPPVGSDTKAQWRGDFEYDSNSLDLPVYNIKAVIGSADEVIAMVSAETYTMPDYSLSATSPTYQTRTDQFTKISRGITLTGADPTSGSTRKEITGLAEDSYFWGTSAESLYAMRATTSTYAEGLTYALNNSNQQFYVPFMGTLTNSSVCYADAGLKYNPFTNILYTVASSALYADLAERYESDAVYESGTVLIIGGTAEVTVTSKRANTAVAGIVSKSPAYMMNSEAGSDLTHPYIALKGRVPCKVSGPVKKGELLVTSHRDGFAEAWKPGDDPNAVIGKSLQNFNGAYGIVEVKV